MSISRGVRKAAKAADVQSRGLEGKRNSQGDFAQAMPEDVQTKGVQDAVSPDIQNYVNDVKSQIDEIDTRYEELYNAELQGADDASGSIVKEMSELKAEKGVLINDLVTKLEENGVEVPPAIRDLETDSLRDGAEYSPDENQVMF